MNNQKFPALLGIAAGLLAVILSIVLMASGGNAAIDALDGKSVGERTSYSYYGGDAYTGIQQAAADTANNVRLQSSIVLAGFRALPDLIPATAPGFAAVLLCLGLGMIAYFWHMLAAANAQRSFESKLIAAMDKLTACDCCAPCAAEPVQESCAADDVAAAKPVVEEVADEAPVCDEAIAD